MKRIVVTGGAGYIGSVLCGILIKKGYRVRVLDRLMFGGESLMHLIGDSNFEFVRGDIRDRDTVAAGLKDADAVVHLAAIVGDPACAKQPELAEEINWNASVQLFDLCRETPKVKQFVFASTCSNYGKMKDTDYVDETSPLDPVSHYARLKVKFEQYILDSKTRDDFTPTPLRFATVYGFSPRMRFDLTVNEFTRDLWAGRKLTVFGEQFWRPYCHVSDLASSCVKVLESSPDIVSRNVFNVGNTAGNYTKLMIVDMIRKYLPGAAIEFVHKEEDPRDYRVNFSKIEKILGYHTYYCVDDGIREILKALQSGIMSDPFNARHSNS